jgi:hypothetical protein
METENVDERAGIPALEILIRRYVLLFRFVVTLHWEPGSER